MKALVCIRSHIHLPRAGAIKLSASSRRRACRTLHSPLYLDIGHSITCDVAEVLDLQVTSTTEQDISFKRQNTGHGTEGGLIH